MSWNQPGNGGRDPWNRDNHSGGGGKGPQWDDLLKKLRQKFGRFGGGGGIAIVVVIIILLWLIFSSYTVIGARETGVVLKFGSYDRSIPSGFHLKLPYPFEHVYKVKTSKVRSVSDEVQMLTNDENIVHINFNLQWQITDARQYLFSIRNPEQTINEAAEASVRAVVGANDMSKVLSGQGAQLVTQTRKRLQKTLTQYHTGMHVNQVSFQNVAPPDQVQDAFDDVNKAREDKQRLKNEARAYASKIVPVARGDAARIAAQAAGYKAARVARAKGEVKRFKQILKPYTKAPEVTRKRLWLETMEDLLSDKPKVVDGSSGSNVFYLKMDAGKAPAPSSTTHMPGAGSALQSGALPTTAASVHDVPAKGDAQ